MIRADSWRFSTAEAHEMRMRFHIRSIIYYLLVPELSHATVLSCTTTAVGFCTGMGAPTYAGVPQDPCWCIIFYCLHRRSEAGPNLARTCCHILLIV